MRPTRLAERIEWGAGIVSGLAVAGIVGFLLWEALFRADSLPRLGVTAEPPRVEAGRTHLRYALTNDSSRAAAAVTLSLTVRDGDTLVEERSVTIDYVPAHSTVTGGLYLPEAAQGLDIGLAVEGYVDP